MKALIRANNMLRDGIGVVLVLVALASPAAAQAQTYVEAARQCIYQLQRADPEFGGFVGRDGLIYTFGTIKQRFLLQYCLDLAGYSTQLISTTQR
jgi:hypothetical protein